MNTYNRNSTQKEREKLLVNLNLKTYRGMGIKGGTWAIDLELGNMAKSS